MMEWTQKNVPLFSRNNQNKLKLLYFIYTKSFLFYFITLVFIFYFQHNSKMSQERPFEGDNGNYINALIAKNIALEGKLGEAKQKAKMAKNEVRNMDRKKLNFIRVFQLEKIIQKNPQQLEELTNVIALLEGKQKKTINLDQMELELTSEKHQNLLDRHRLPLPLELNCQIFECLKAPIQTKFICELGRGIYGMFRQKVLTKVG
jgi:hypothetical protein